MFDSKKLEKSMYQLQAGDNSGFDIIYEQTYRLVYYIIYSIVKERSRAEDIMQDVYMKVIEKIDTYTRNISAKAWISTIARNLAINAYKKDKRETIVSTEDVDFGYEKEDTFLIDMASRHLEDDDFLIISLCVLEGYKRREVAEILGLSTSGVTWKLNQALEKLKKIVEEVD